MAFALLMILFGGLAFVGVWARRSGQAERGVVALVVDRIDEYNSLPVTLPERGTGFGRARERDEVLDDFLAACGVWAGRVGAEVEVSRDRVWWRASGWDGEVVVRRHAAPGATLSWSFRWRDVWLGPRWLTVTRGGFFVDAPVVEQAAAGHVAEPVTTVIPVSGGGSVSGQGEIPWTLSLDGPVPLAMLACAEEVAALERTFGAARVSPALEQTEGEVGVSFSWSSELVARWRPAESLAALEVLRVRAVQMTAQQRWSGAASEVVEAMFRAARPSGTLRASAADWLGGRGEGERVLDEALVEAFGARRVQARGFALVRALDASPGAVLGASLEVIRAAMAEQDVSGRMVAASRDEDEAALRQRWVMRVLEVCSEQARRDPQVWDVGLVRGVREGRARKSDAMILANRALVRALALDVYDWEAWGPLPSRVDWRVRLAMIMAGLGVWPIAVVSARVQTELDRPDTQTERLCSWALRACAGLPEEPALIEALSGYAARWGVSSFRAVLRSMWRPEWTFAGDEDALLVMLFDAAPDDTIAQDVIRFMVRRGEGASLRLLTLIARGERACPAAVASRAREARAELEERLSGIGGGYHGALTLADVGDMRGGLTVADQAEGGLMIVEDDGVL